MSEAKANVAREKFLAGLGGALFWSPLAAYANHFHNSFHFDDAHTIVNNAAIRELRNIPLFFRDATTFSSLPSNQSYRPLVSTLLAIDYRLGQDCDRSGFILSIFALFVALTLLLAFVIHRLLDYGNFTSQRLDRARRRCLVRTAPGKRGHGQLHHRVVRSDLDARRDRVVCGLLRLPAVCAGHISTFCRQRSPSWLNRPRRSSPCSSRFSLLFPDGTITGRTTGRRALAYFEEIVPSFLICGAMLLFVQHMTPHSWVAGAANAHNYLITQPYVALLYLKTFFWPSGLSADYDLNPFTTTDDPRFWAGFAFSVFFIAVAIAAAVFKKTRVIGFGLLWFLIALLPTSLFPLAEVMNDHRTFLPYIGLVIAMAGAASLLIGRAVRFASAGENRGRLAQSCCSCAQTPTPRSKETRFGKPRKRSGTTSC